MQCLQCYQGEMVVPPDRHPSYLICPNCGAMELVYLPQDYQNAIHNVDYVEILNVETGEMGYKPQIIASFGKLNLPN